MPRKLRVEFPGAIYHVMSRGDRREPMFSDDVDRQHFLQTLAEARQKTEFPVHAYRRMSNHFHLVVETPDANLVAEMRWLLSTYWMRVDRVLGEHGIRADTAAGRREFEERMEGELGEHHAGELRRESAELRTERIIAEELSRPGWLEADLEQRRQSDPVKLALGARLRGPSPRRSGSGRAGGRRL